MKPLITVFIVIAVATAASTFGQLMTPPKALGDVPAYHPAPPAKGVKLPSILAKEQLTGPAFQNNYQVHAYELAAKIPRTLYQQPCYCHCDRNVGHTSLHTCFTSAHGAHCSTCMQEVYYSYRMTKLKKTAKEIRDGIIRGDFASIILETAASIN